MPRIGIYFPRFSGTIYEVLSAPASAFEIVLGYVGAAASKSIVLGMIILATSALFVPMHIVHPFWMLAFLVLTSLSASACLALSSASGPTASTSCKWCRCSSSRR